MKRYCSMLPRQPDSVESCCQAHDRAYGYSGPETGRKTADIALRECMLERGASPWLAWPVYIAVRAFGWVRWYWIRLDRRAVRQDRHHHRDRDDDGAEPRQAD